MDSFRRSKRSDRLQLAVSGALLGLAASRSVHAAAPLFDNITPLETGIGLQSDSHLYYTTPNPNPTNRPPDSAITDSFEGEAYVVPAGTTDLTGMDFWFGNSTNDSTLSPYPQYNGGAGTTYNALKVTIYVWGTVTPSPLLNSSNPALSPTNPAFSNLLATESFVDHSTVPVDTHAYAYEDQGAPGVFPGISFANLSGPVALNGLTTVGITINVQGSTDGGTTFANIAGLTPLIDADVPPTVGATQTDAFYINDSGEANGNFTSGPHYFQEQNSSGTVVPFNYQAVTTRVYGDGPAVIYHWTSPNDGVYSDSTQWSPSGVPAGNDTGIFNLSSSGYSVEVPDTESANNLFIQNDNVSFDFDAQYSYLGVLSKLTVGQSATANTPTTGTLSLINTGDVYLGVMEAANVVVGGNGGTGTLSVQAGVFFFSDNDTTINAGSVLSVGQFAKFGTGTLTIAGSTNAWSGQLDIGPSAVNIFNGSIATVTNQIKTGYNSGKWNGQGIISSTAAADTTHLTAVGAIVNNDGNGNALYGSGTALGLFDGQSPSVNSVLVRYTFYGDANLDGKVDGSDYARIDNGALLHLTGWYNGDFNYDGVINGSDYTLIDNAYNTQGAAIPFPFGGSGPDVLSSDAGHSVQLSGDGTDQAHLTSLGDSEASTDAVVPGAAIATTTAEIAATSAVPEPTSLGLLTIAATPLLSRRSRRKS